MSLSLDDVRWVAHLARLDVPEQELAVLAGQLGAILDYVQQLQQLNTDGVEPLAHPLDIRDVFRPDDDSMVRHFAAIADRTGIPVIIYNVIPWSYLLPPLLVAV